MTTRIRSFRLSDDIYNRLSAVAEARGVTVSVIIREALEAALANIQN